MNQHSLNLLVSLSKDYNAKQTIETGRMLKSEFKNSVQNPKLPLAATKSANKNDKMSTKSADKTAHFPEIAATKRDFNCIEKEKIQTQTNKKLEDETSAKVDYVDYCENIEEVSHNGEKETTRSSEEMRKDKQSQESVVETIRSHFGTGNTGGTENEKADGRVCVANDDDEGIMPSEQESLSTMRVAGDNKYIDIRF